MASALSKFIETIRNRSDPDGVHIISFCMGSEPMTVPLIALAVGQFQLFAQWDLLDNILGFTFSYILVFSPFVIIVLFTAIWKLHPMTEKMAAGMGASTRETWFKVLLPQLKPAILRAWLLCFFLSFDETILAIYLIMLFLNRFIFNIFVVPILKLFRNACGTV